MAYLEVLLQTILAFTAILVYTRILGKQQVGELTFFEYINGITFGSIAAVLATDIGPQRTGLHFLGLTLFAAFTYGMGYLSLKSRPARKLVGGEPTVVVHNGKILEKNMSKMLYNVDELMMQLRQEGYFDLNQVEFAVLEEDGQLSVLPKSQYRPLTPADLQVPTAYEGLPSELIIDGRVIWQNLRQNNLDREWLLRKLAQRGVRDVRDVFYAALDSSGNLYLDWRQDSLTSPRDVTDADLGGAGTPQNGQ